MPQVPTAGLKPLASAAGSAAGTAWCIAPSAVQPHMFSLCHVPHRLVTDNAASALGTKCMLLMLRASQGAGAEVGAVPSAGLAA